MMNTIDVGLGGYTILQNTNKEGKKIMSYIITTPNEKVIVIDGGLIEDGDRLREKILSLGGVVHMWHITHPHHDHMGAFIHIMQDMGDIQVESIYYDFPPKEWMVGIHPKSEKAYGIILDILKENEDICIQIERGMQFSIDGVKFEVLADSRYHCKTNNINETSAAYRLEFPNGIVAIFLGDMMEVSGGYLADYYGKKLKADIVQVSHHGQWGVPKRAYEFMNPKVCLWPTNDNIWENDNGEGYDTGPWRIFEIRDWMDEIGVEVHGVMKDGEVIVI